jgi:hypothetical protein
LLPSSGNTQRFILFGASVDVAVSVMPYYSTLDNLATQIVFILINKDQRDKTDGTVQERYQETCQKPRGHFLHVCTVHQQFPSPPHNRLVCCHDIDHVMNDEDIES